MKFMFKHNPYTCIVLRDRKRPALRFRVNPFMLMLFPLLALTLAFCTLWLYKLYSDYAERNRQLQVHLEESILAFTQVIDEKNATIDQLQTEIAGLSEQAREVQKKVDELKRLEMDLLHIADSTPPLSAAIAPRSKPEVSISSYTENTAMEDKAEDRIEMGGQAWPVESEELYDIAADASRTFASLMEDMEELNERLEEQKHMLEQLQERLRVTPSIWPTDSRRVTSHYGYRRDPFNRSLSFHAGIDIGANFNDPVYATADGTVTESGYDRYLGHYILIDHGSGLKTRYMHLNKRYVEQGDQVKKGETIGLIGSTGRSTGPHLHYEVWVDGKVADPRAYLPSEHEGGN